MPTREEISRYLWENVFNEEFTFPPDKISYIFSEVGIFALIKAGREKDYWEEFDEKYMYLTYVDRGRVFNYDALSTIPEVMYQFLKEREWTTSR